MVQSEYRPVVLIPRERVDEMKKNTLIRTLTVILLLLIFVVGGLFFIRPSVIDKKRAQSEEKILECIEGGQTDIPELFLPEVSGEDFFEEDELEISASEATTENEKEAISGYGIIKIPSINLKMPIMCGADRRSLRCGAGWLPSSAEMGQAGNCVIFGHRMKRFGRHFNRLDELTPGDSIALTDADGISYDYVVTEKEVISPNELRKKLEKHNEGFGLTLVTCTPTGIGSHRLLVYAELQ